MPPRILLAEDDPGVRVPLADFLRAQEFDVKEAINPRQAISALKAVRFNLIILDLIMPDDDPQGGEKVLHFMNTEKNEKNKGTPVILASVWGYNGPAQQAMNACPGAVKAKLTKPFPPEEMLDKIKKVMQST